MYTRKPAITLKHIPENFPGGGIYIFCLYGESVFVYANPQKLSKHNTTSLADKRPHKSLCIILNFFYKTLRAGCIRSI